MSHFSAQSPAVHKRQSVVVRPGRHKANTAKWLRMATHSSKMLVLEPSRKHTRGSVSKDPYPHRVLARGTRIARQPSIGLAQLVRSRRERFRVPILAVTGTAGKTTTVRMLASIMQRRYRTRRTPGNLNIGPQNARLLLASNPRADALVLEMGMCRRGQIAHQCRLLAPDVGVITNIGHAHLSGCGGFAGVVKAKSELVYGLKHGGVIVLNSDDYGTRRVNLSQFTGRIVWYGRAAKARYRLLNVSRYRGGIGFSVRAEGSTHYLYIPVLGERCVYDALAAASAARQVGMPWELIKRGLASYKSPRGRFTPLKGPHGALVIDDTFNANPLSVANGLRTLKEISYGRTTIAALGGMGEQGAGWRDVHWRVGRIAARLGIDQLLTVGGKARLIAAGALAAGMPRSRVHVFADQAGAARYLRPRLHSGMILLAKGSHVTHMKRLVRALIR